MRHIKLWVTVAALMAAMIGAGALPAVAQEDGAFIYSSACYINLPVSPYSLQTEIQSVITPGGAQQLTCQFEGPTIEETIVA